MLFLAQATASQMDAGILQLIGGLGQSAAAVVMAWLFVVYLQKKDLQQEKRDDRVFSQFSELAKDRGQIIRDNTSALQKIESSVDRLIEVVEKAGSHDGE